MGNDKSRNHTTAPVYQSLNVYKGGAVMTISPYSPDTLTNLLLWTPWDDRYNSKIPDSIREALYRERGTFYRDCFVPLELAPNEVDMWNELSSCFDYANRKATVISSFAGVGKSTILHAMLEEKGMSKNAIILDALESVDLFPEGGWFKWLKEHCHRKPLHNKLIKLLIDALYNLLCLPTPANRDKSIAEDIALQDMATTQLVRIVVNRMTYFQALDAEYCPLFEVVEQYCNGKILHNSSDQKRQITASYTNQVADTLFSLFQNEDDPVVVVKRILELLCIIAICNIDDPSECRICVAFDNIEHFLVDDTIIHDNEICSLLHMLNGNDGDAFITEQNAIYRRRFETLTNKPDKSMVFSERIRLVLVIREFTANMVPRMADELGRGADCIVNLHKQIPLREIVRKRVDFLLRVTGEDIRSTEPIGTVIKILQDEYMATRISQMFSYDKRKAVRNLIDAFYREDSQGKVFVRHNLICAYNRLAAPLIHSKGEVKRAQVHGQHQLVFRALFDSMLDNLRTGSTNLGEMLRLDNFNAERGSIRQILVYLARRSFLSSEDVPPRRQPFVKLSDLIRYIYLKPDIVDTDASLRQFPESNPNDIKELASKLNILRSHSHLERLSPLILLRFEKSGPIEDSHIEDVLISACKNPASEVDEHGIQRYGVKCTIAGRMFVEYCASFEFVAARHYKSLLQKTKPSYNRPLFEADLDAMIAFADYIEVVSELTLSDCIGKMVEKIVDFLTIDGMPQYNHLYNKDLVYRAYSFSSNCHTGIEYTHAERLIRHHIRYIDDFRIYAVQCLKARNGQQDAQTIRDFSIKLLGIIGKYIDKFGELTDGDQYMSGERSKHFFIGGPRRNTTEDWGRIQPLGYKNYFGEFVKAQISPLLPISVVPANDDE